MKKSKSFHIDTQIGGGTLEISEKSDGGYSASYHGLSGCAHEKKHGHETPLAANVDFTCDDVSYDNLITKCRVEIEKRDSEILDFNPIER
jgi:hypothetical protein